MTLQSYNPSTENLEKSYLSAAYSVGVTSIVIRNNDRFSVGGRILIGEMGSENAEMVTVSAVNADKVTLTVGATKFPHSASDPVYVLKYDQVRFYRSTTTIGGSYTALDTVDLDVDNKDKKTYYDDTTGMTAYFYKVAYYHSIAATESELSEPIPGEGYSRKQVGTIVNDFLTEVGDLQQDYMKVPQILSLMNEVNEDLIGQSRRPLRCLSKKVLKTITADDDRISLPDDLVRLDRVKHENTDGIVTTIGNKKIVSIEELEYAQYEQNTIPNPVGAPITALAIDDTTNELVIFPTPTTTQTDKITIYYWGEFDVISSLSDTIQVPVGRIYKLFLLSRYYRIRAKKDDSFLNLSREYLQEYTTEIVKLQRAQKVNIGTPMSFLPDIRSSGGLTRR